jgi:hypothetical protein
MAVIARIGPAIPWRGGLSPARTHRSGAQGPAPRIDPIEHGHEGSAHLHSTGSPVSSQGASSRNP